MSQKQICEDSVEDELDEVKKRLRKEERRETRKTDFVLSGETAGVTGAEPPALRTSANHSDSDAEQPAAAPEVVAIPGFLDSSAYSGFVRTRSMTPTMRSNIRLRTRGPSMHSYNRSPSASLFANVNVAGSTIGRSVAPGSAIKDHGGEMGNKSPEDFHEILRTFVESKIFSDFIFVIIVANTVILLANTWDIVQVTAGWYISILDTVFLALYVIEAVLKVCVYRLSYFKDVWNVLDLMIVIVNAADFALPLFANAFGGSQMDNVKAYRFFKFLKIFRAIRAIRVLRTIRFLTNLQVIIATCLQSIYSMGAIVGLMLLFMYMFAVFGRGLYAQAAPRRFGSIWLALFTLFDLLTLDDWFFIYEDVVKGDPKSGHVIIYLALYIILEYLIFLNLVVAVLVDNFQLALGAAHEQAKQQKAKEAEQTAAAIVESSSAAKRSSDDIDKVMSEVCSYDDLSGFQGRDSRFPTTFSDCYGDTEPARREVLSKCFMLCAALEYNNNLFEMQRHTFSLLVDICVEHNQ